VTRAVRRLSPQTSPSSQLPHTSSPLSPPPTTTGLSKAPLNSWPDDLSRFVAQQLDVCTSRIREGPARAAAFKLVLATLSDFRAMLTQVRSRGRARRGAPASL
jgi:hypothetical protein